MDWIHFVGKTYYTAEQYAEEAAKFGASRRVNPRLLRGMSWGDRVFLAQGDMMKKNRINPFTGSRIFGYFTITTLGGVPQDVIEDLAEELDLEITNAPIQAIGFVRRRCGHYLLGPSLKKVETPLSQIADYIDFEENPSLLLQGKFTSIPDALTTVLPDIGFRWGFRKFDGDAFLDCVRHGDPAVFGQLLPEAPTEPQLAGKGTLRVIDEYSQTPVYGKKSRFDY